MTTPPNLRPHLGTLVEDMRALGSRIAVQNREGLRHLSHTYAQVAELAGRCARLLDSKGIKKDDRAVIWGENGGQWLGAFFGCVLRGVVAVPIDVAGSPEFAHKIIADVQAKFVFGAAIPNTPSLLFNNFEHDLPHEPLWTPLENLSEADTLQIVFTSGTTGEPKGIVHTHGNVLASLRPIEREIQKYIKYERIYEVIGRHPLGILHTLPLSHVFGQFMGIWIPVLLGATVTFESSLLPKELMGTIHRERVSVLAAVPRTLEILQRYCLSRFPEMEQRLARAETLSAWRRWWLFRDIHRALGWRFWAFVSGGATLASDTEEFWTSIGLAVIQGYGMTETVALVSLSHPFHLSRGSIGRVLPGREVRLNKEGEILVRGATVSGATWEKGGMHRSDSEWLETGDLGEMDAPGNLAFRGRKKDVIVTSAGLNIFPEDLESALQHQPGVATAAVVPFNGPQGPQPFAALIMRGNANPEEAVVAANRELADFQQIRRWMLWPDPDFPRTSTGKVLRRRIAAAIPDSGQTVSAPGGGLAGILQRISGVDAASLPDSARLSEDLHLDSLGKTEVQSAIEMQFGIDTTATDFQNVQTLGELKALLKTPAVTETHELAGTPRPSPYAYPTWPWSRMMTASRIGFFDLLMRPLVKFLAAPRIDRLLRSEPSTPCLIVSNHVTEYDAPLILSALSRHMRNRVAIAMAGEMLRDFRRSRNPFDRARYWLALALFNVFPLPQHGSYRESFAHAGRAMDHGFNVLVFPEGRRTPDAQMHKFQSGAGILWTQLGCPVLPVYLEGLAQLHAEHGRWFRSGRITVRIGELIKLLPNLDAKQAAELLEQGVRALSRETGSTAL